MIDSSVLDQNYAFTKINEEKKRGSDVKEIQKEMGNYGYFLTIIPMKDLQ